MKLIKNAKSKYFLLPCHGNECTCSKEKKTVFYLLITVPNLYLY